MLKAVLFDLDGTICDTVPLCVEAMRRAVRDASGREVEVAEVRANFGPCEEGMLRAMAPANTTAALASYLRWYEELHDMCPRPFDGMTDILSRLRKRGLYIALVTGKGKGSADISLRRFGLAPYFSAVETGSPAGSMKDINIRKIIAATGIPSAEAAYIGDAVSDVREARAAGVRPYSAAWAESADRHGLVDAEPDRIFYRIADFADYLDEITLT